MPIDTSIYNALMKPRSVADYAAEYDQQDIRKGLMQRNALMLEEGQQKKALYERGLQDDQAIRNALARLPADAAPNARMNALRDTGIPAGYAQADAYGKTLAEQQKAKTEAASKNAALIKQYSGVLMQSPNRQTWESLLAMYQRQTGDDTQEMRAIFEQAGDDPAMLKQIAAGLSMEADKLLPKVGTVNAGNAQVTQAINPITGVPTQTGSVPIGQSPDSVASVGAQYANASAVRDQAAATRDAAKITAGVAETTGLRKEFADLPEVKKFKNAIPAYQAIVQAAKINNPQADINLIYGLAKLYDPDSVVREGEYDTIANSQSIPEWLKGQAQRLAGGGKLTAETKAQIVEQANIRINSYKGEYDGARSGYEGIAKGRGLATEGVFAPVGKDLNSEPDGKVPRVKMPTAADIAAEAERRRKLGAK